MKCPPDTCSGHSPAWKKLLLIGTLLACSTSTCSASLELPLAEGGGGRPPVPGSPDGLRTASRFPGREAQPAAVVSPEGLRGPAHMGREWLGSRGPLLITNVTDADSGATVLGTSRGQGRSNNSPRQVQLRTSPSTVRGIIYSDLNFSVIMAWTVTMDPEPELTWTLDGRLCGTGEKLFIRRLSRELLGTYVCTGRNSQQLLPSYPVTVSLPPEPRESPPPRTPAALRLVCGGLQGSPEHLPEAWEAPPLFFSGSGIESLNPGALNLGAPSPALFTFYFETDSC
ncbi:immunoglobulin superfamily member 23 [Marmota monax]|uniref:immunoglobulin superfamily member 23 n=1 Tax=Marmota monax TaxID=9995 RepID=UPI0026F079E9|nr:immunoglobulin superfamily member 23 [Marmota monax]